MTYFVYILECGDGSLYTGITTDVLRRFFEHATGAGAAYTRSRGVKKFAYVEECGTRSTALRREAAIKRMTRPAKLALIHGLSRAA